MFRTARYALIALCTMAATATAVEAGPPWISVEYPTNPHHASTRGALFLVHTFHHGDHIAPAVNASFEGLVDGQRRTVAAQVLRTHRDGVYAVRGDVPANGTWVAVVRMRDGTAPAVALVRLDARAQVLAVEVPVDRARDGWHIPRDVSERDIRAALENAPGARTAAASRAGAAAALVLLLAVGMRRRKA